MPIWTTCDTTRRWQGRSRVAQRWSPRTGYTGEDGFEVIVSARRRPVGLGSAA